MSKNHFVQFFDKKISNLDKPPSAGTRMSVVMPPNELNDRIWDIVRYSGEFLFLVTPNMNISDRFRSIIEMASKGGTNVFMVFSEDVADAKIYAWLKGLDRVDIRVNGSIRRSCFANSDILF